MPSDTSVSIDTDVPRVAQAAWWNGHARHPTTGAATRSAPTASPGTATEGTATSSTDRSLSGMNNTSATISRRRRSATRAASVPVPAAARLGTGPASAGVKHFGVVAGLLDRVDQLLHRNRRRCVTSGPLGRQIHRRRDTVNQR